MVKIDGTIVHSVVDGRAVSFFVIDPLDAIQKHHLQGEFYEREELDMIRMFMRSDRTFIDIGANVGNHAVFVSKFFTAPKIIVFEPNPVAIDVLRVNLLLNRCERVDTRYLGVALGASEDRVRIVADPRPNNLGGASVEIDDVGDTLLVAADDLLLGEPVGFIKMDVEGMEMATLAGLEKTIARWRPNMFVEVMEANTEDFMNWAAASSYHVGGTIQRYAGVMNYILLPDAPA
ncbi:MAG TPA: FkbM family methyltransferase [Caulobacteraceae bacterium]|jgi:FkbM family methyltransferase|nr:FkbM family methyltransferase [Caulobacteraceae bacterium]